MLSEAAEGGTTSWCRLPGLGVLGAERAFPMSQWSSWRCWQPVLRHCTALGMMIQSSVSGEVAARPAGSVSGTAYRSSF